MLNLMQGIQYDRNTSKDLPVIYLAGSLQDEILQLAIKDTEGTDGIRELRI